MVPNCPVCHQSTALASAHLEAAGIPTVIMGCAMDIIEYVGAPRLLFNDLPLAMVQGCRMIKHLRIWPLDGSRFVGYR